MWFPSAVPTSRLPARARRAADLAHRRLGEDVRHLREDAGLSRRALAIEAGVDPAYLQRIEDGRASASLGVYAQLAVALGADLASHLYPNTGPPIRDRHQARILEAVVRRLHPRWTAYTEVPVRKPARGWIDLVVHDARAGCLVAIEIESALPRIEQQVRWAAEKEASLPSWDGISRLGPVTTTSRALFLRSTQATRAIAAEFAGQLGLAYPAHPEDGITALFEDAAWPGPCLIRVEVAHDGVRFLQGRRRVGDAPRAAEVGRKGEVRGPGRPTAAEPSQQSVASAIIDAR